MPISDNECDDCDVEYSQHGMSKAEQRRSNKPIMEKRRRARINHCLNELKSLILDAMKKDPARHSKLEKADILEMTVKHLQNVQRQQLSQAVAADPHTLHKFKSGFNECATEVSRFVSRLDGVEPAVRQRLVAHLSGCVQGLQQIAPFSFPGLNHSFSPGLSQGLGQGLSQGVTTPLGNGLLGPTPSVLQQVQLAGDINNNNNNNNSRVQSLQLIPSRLPTGELALLLPNSGQLSSQLSSQLSANGGLLFPTPAPPAPGVADGAASVGVATTPVIKSSPHPSAFTAVGPLGGGMPTPPSSTAEDGDAPDPATIVPGNNSSPDTPPSSARALQLSRVAADSSTSSPESSSLPSSGGRTASISSPTSSSVEVKLELVKQEVETPTGRGHLSRLPRPRAPSALDFSLKRCSSDSSEAEAEGEGEAGHEAGPPCKVPRYTLSVMSAPASYPATSSTEVVPPHAAPHAALHPPPHPPHPLLAVPHAPHAPPASRGLSYGPASLAPPGLPRPQPLHPAPGETDRDMWRPW